MNTTPKKKVATPKAPKQYLSSSHYKNLNTRIVMKTKRANVRKVKRKAARRARRINAH